MIVTEPPCVVRNSSLCEHALVVLLCNGNIAATHLSSGDDWCNDAVCVDVASQGAEDKSCQIILAYSIIRSAIVFMWRQICPQPRKVSEEERRL